MRNLTFGLLAVVLIAVTSCKKQNPNIDTTEPEKVSDTSYFIEGVADIRTHTIGLSYSTISVIRNTAADKRVTISLNGAPKGVKSELEIQSGYPPFATNLELLLRFVPRGKYPLNIITTANGSPSKTYTIDLIVDTLTTRSCQFAFRNGFTTDHFSATSNKAGNSLLDIQPAVYTDSQQTIYKGLYISRIPLYHEVNTARNFIFVSSNAVDMNSDPKQNHVNFDFDCETGKMSINNVMVAARTTFPSNITDTFIVNGTGYVDAEKETYTFKYTSKSKNDAAKEAVEYTLTGDFRF